MRSLRRVAPGGTGFSRPGGIHKLARQEGPWDGQDVSHGDGARVPVCAGCGKPVDAADPNVQHRVPRRRFRTMGGVQIGDAGLGESFHPGGFSGVDYRLDQERPDLD